MKPDTVNAKIQKTMDNKEQITDINDPRHIFYGMLNRFVKNMGEVKVVQDAQTALVIVGKIVQDKINKSDKT